MNLADLDAGALIDLFRAGTATPSDAIEACVARLDEREPSVSAFRTRCDDLARAAAARSDVAWREGSARPLEGVPFAVKDIIDTAGVLTTLGTSPSGYRMPERNATAVQRLLDAGGVMVGKSTVSEYAFGDTREEHQSSNPWDPGRWAGGSSTGSAVALASREVPLALGTDTGGSIRVPASYSGVSGIKPTFGRVPRDGVAQCSWTLDHAGPMARSVDDLALMFGVLDPTFADDEARDLRGVRLGVPTNWFCEGCDDRVLHAFEEAVSAMVALGATRHDVHVDLADTVGIISWTITVAEYAANREADAHRLHELTASAVDRIAGGRTLCAPDYIRALRARHLVQRALDDVFSVVDVVVTPATPTPAPRLVLDEPIWSGGDVAWLERIARNYLIANITGIPALVVPAGFADGLPVGLQVLAAPNADSRCLRVGRAFQAATEHHRAAPPMFR